MVDKQAERRSTLAAQPRQVAGKTVFVACVSEARADSYLLTLCTGDHVELPRSVVTSVRTLGRTTSPSTGIEKEIARIELADSPEARAVAQLASALQGAVDGSAGAAAFVAADKEGADQIKITCVGVACSARYDYYQAAYPIISFSLNRSENCVCGGVVQTGPQQLRVVHDALPGTRCGYSYTGYVYVDITMQGP